MLWITQHLLIVTLLMVMSAVALALIIFFALTRIYSHEPTRSQFGSALVSILLAVLFSVVLGNWYGVWRDRENRLRALRDQHFAQIRPVLRMESSKLLEIAAQADKQAHFSSVTHYENVSNVPEDDLWPDVISRDLAQHFPAYDNSKRSLLFEIKAQDDEFRVALAATESQIKPIANLDSYWREVAAISFVESCTGRGQGVKLRITDNGFSFEFWGASISNSGGSPPQRPSPDQVAAFRAFQSLKPDASLDAHCHSLKHRAEAIFESAKELSKQAQFLSESTILKGTCDFLRSDNLSD